MYAACAECVVVAAVRRDASSAELGCGCTRREYVAGRWVGAGGLCVGMGRGMGAASEDGRQPKKKSAALVVRGAWDGSADGCGALGSVAVGGVKGGTGAGDAGGPCVGELETRVGPRGHYGP